jgi:myo-inositol 2-dehydrogenase/D-chiro-inositol 1-dehydrogenase/scyllo-inositol 2-dehydrogenase (NAD+)
MGQDMTKPIGICVVGAGRVGGVHAATLAQSLPEASLAAVVDENLAAAAKLAERFGVAARFASLAQALEAGGFEAVVLTTPTFTHRALAVAAAAAGKHVFCEKPMALTLAECDEMIAAAERAGVILQVGFMRRFDPDFEAAWARIEAGEIGRPMMVKSLTHGPGLPPAWARDLTTSNGMLAEVNSHDWDTLRWLAGADFQRVYAEVANFKGERDGVHTPHFYDNVLVNVRFESGALGSISGICPCDYGYDGRVEIVGEKGLMQIGDVRGHALVVCTDRERGLVTPIFRTWPERFAAAYVREMRHFVACIESGARPRAGGAEGRWAVAGALAATRSFLEERSVRLAEVLAAPTVGAGG